MDIKKLSKEELFKLLEELNKEVTRVEKELRSRENMRDRLKRLDYLIG